MTDHVPPLRSLQGVRIRIGDRVVLEKEGSANLTNLMTQPQTPDGDDAP